MAHFLFVFHLFGEKKIFLSVTIAYRKILSSFKKVKYAFKICFQLISNLEGGLFDGGTL